MGWGEVLAKVQYRCGEGRVEFLRVLLTVRSCLVSRPPSVSVFEGTAIPWHTEVASPPDRGLDITDD